MSQPVSHAVRVRALARGLAVCMALFGLFTVSVCRAHDDHAPYPEVEQHEPTPLPDRIVLTWSGDPATTQDVTWRTSVAVDHGVVGVSRSRPHNRLL